MISQGTPERITGNIQTRGVQSCAPVPLVEYSTACMWWHTHTHTHKGTGAGHSGSESLSTYRHLTFNTLN
jgi:hypothetical protein